MWITYITVSILDQRLSSPSKEMLFWEYDCVDSEHANSSFGDGAVVNANLQSLFSKLSIIDLCAVSAYMYMYSTYLRYTFCMNLQRMRNSSSLLMYFWSHMSWTYISTCTDTSIDTMVVMTVNNNKNYTRIIIKRYTSADTKWWTNTRGSESKSYSGLGMRFQ